MTRRLITTPPEIYKAETGQQPANISAEMVGDQYMIRSDFPADVYINGQLRAEVGGFGRPNLEYVSSKSPADQTVEIKLPVGFGGDPKGGLNDHNVQIAELYARHGILEVLCSDQSEPWPDPPDPDFLPKVVYDFFQDIPKQDENGDPRTAAWGAYFLSSDIWKYPVRGPARRLPDEIWLHSCVFNCEHPAGPPAARPMPVDELPYEISFTKLDQELSIPDDSTILWHMAGGVTHAPVVAAGAVARMSWETNLGKHRVPLRSIFTPWGQETPVVGMGIFGSDIANTDAQIHVRLHASFL